MCNSNFLIYSYSAGTLWPVDRIGYNDGQIAFRFFPGNGLRYLDMSWRPIGNKPLLNSMIIAFSKAEVRKYTVTMDHISLFSNFEMQFWTLSYHFKNDIWFTKINMNTNILILNSIVRQWQCTWNTNWCWNPALCSVASSKSVSEAP